MKSIFINFFNIDQFLLKLFLLYIGIVAVVFYLLIQPEKPMRGPSPSGMSDFGVMIVLFTVLILPFLIILTVLFCCICCWHCRRLKRLEIDNNNIKEDHDKEDHDIDESGNIQELVESKKIQ